MSYNIEVFRQVADSFSTLGPHGYIGKDSRGQLTYIEVNELASNGKALAKKQAVSRSELVKIAREILKESRSDQLQSVIDVLIAVDHLVELRRSQFRYVKICRKIQEIFYKLFCCCYKKSDSPKLSSIQILARQLLVKSLQIRFEEQDDIKVFSSQHKAQKYVKQWEIGDKAVYPLSRNRVAMVRKMQDDVVGLVKLDANQLNELPNRAVFEQNQLSLRKFISLLNIEKPWKPDPPRPQ